LLDAEILADVYLLMTGGQTKLNLRGESDSVSAGGITRVSSTRQPFKVIHATADELGEHNARLDVITKESGQCIWNKM
jgi:DNA polymerase-3 subunit epsilon